MKNHAVCQLHPLLLHMAEDGSVIWKIMFIGQDMLVGEERSLSDGRVSFFVISTGEARSLLKGYVPGEWEGSDLSLAGLESTSDTLFYLHAHHAEGPEHRGIWAIDPLQGGKVAWKQPGMSFVANLGSSLLGYTRSSFAGFPERQYHLLDASNGMLLKSFSSEEEVLVQSLRSKAPAEEQRQGVQLPELTGSEGGQGGVERLQHDGVTVSVTHSVTAGHRFSADLELECGDGRRHVGRIASDVSSPYLNYFLLKGVSVYYIKERKELIGVNCSCSPNRGTA
ncbi:hypothetical protein [Prosthecochloris vibrioformis]|uniref:DUF4905 domain-containing protein n=1 Tax=Prosthecochloris vibrioformis TaxID=1098 RepID=A0A5C4S351_PROVB|nr:hypothetical protein [Prosthecochloris vibrioformis]TNJ37201.1 hypothetical protein FGF68_02965 [Prosthecochloris vibrioformis]